MDNYDKTISVLQNLTKSNKDIQNELGFAITLTKFCKTHSISGKNKTINLPDVSEEFGYFTVNECNETGEHIKTICDDKGHSIEIYG